MRAPRRGHRGAGARIGRPSAGGGDGARKVDPRRVEESDGGSGGEDEDEDEDEDEQSGRQASKGAR